ncbi:erythromycin esterase family protein [Nonomuraea dietziae]|uniref:erythromycin esterase family protein n=1 Tax=Nonomuraea dietziae TaxID=65515 RepID=UPI003418919A
MTNAPLSQWIRNQAHPLGTHDPLAPLTDLRPLLDMVGEARIVALGAATRQAREPAALAHRMLRLLVEERGFRSLALEGDDPERVGLAEYVRTGRGRPRALLADARAFWQTEEILDVVRWMRAHNERHPGDPVRFAGTPDGTPQAVRLDSLESMERSLAEHTIQWHEHTGDRIVYWGGIAHTVAAGLPHRTAGAHLRERYGSGYLSLGLTFHHGSLPEPVPFPPAHYAESALSAAMPQTYLLDLRADAPEPVRAWLGAPSATRVIGPGYTTESDADHQLSDGSPAAWFDVIVHSHDVTPARFLEFERPSR